METIRAAAEYLESRLEGRRPETGIVLGSGLGKLAETIKDPIVIPYSDIPGFPLSTAIGHKGNFIAGELGGRQVVAMQGRFHYYEGYPMSLVTLPIRVMKLLGIRNIFVSNAAGGCNPSFHRGNLMIITDHIHLLPNPLIGPNLDEFGPRFPDMTCAYDRSFISKAESIASEMGIMLQKGVYLSTSGPTYETPSEVRFFRTIGADAIGMSTTPEVIVARHCGMNVFGMSVITNISNIDVESEQVNDSEDVVRTADAAAEKMSEIFCRLISEI